MESIFHSLLMLMRIVWGVAVIMRTIGLPKNMGELIIMGAMDKSVFSVLVFTAFLLNMLTPLMLNLEKPDGRESIACARIRDSTDFFRLKGCAMLLEKHPAHWSY